MHICRVEKRIKDIKLCGPIIKEKEKVVSKDLVFVEKYMLKERFVTNEIVIEKFNYKKKIVEMEFEKEIVRVFFLKLITFLI